jgi:hypothetical protein
MTRYVVFFHFFLLGEQRPASGQRLGPDPGPLSAVYTRRTQRRAARARGALNKRKRRTRRMCVRLWGLEFQKQLIFSLSSSRNIQFGVFELIIRWFFG